MLFINEENITKNEYWRIQYQQWKEKELPFYPDSVVYKSSKPQRINELSGRPERPIREGFPLVCSVMTENGTDLVAYCVSPPKKDKVGNLRYKPKTHKMIDALVVQKSKRPDFLFFLERISSAVKGGVIVKEDLEKEAAEKIKKEQPFADCRYFILSENSPLAHNEKKVRALAAAWGISNVDHMEINQLKWTLWDKICLLEKNVGEKGKYIKQFIEQAKEEGITREVKIRNNIQKAIDNNFIIYKSDKVGWFYGSGDILICKLMIEEINQPLEGIYRFYISSPKEYDNLLNYMGDKAVRDEDESYPVEQVYDAPPVKLDKVDDEQSKTQEERIYTKEELEDMNFMKMKKIASTYTDVKPKDKKPYLIEKILENQMV